MQTGNNVSEYKQIKKYPKRYKINTEFEFDILFWTIIPSVNLNFHSKTFEIEWLCFGFYLNFIKII